MLPKLSAPRVEVNGQRLYETPRGKFPSVTSILSATKDKGYLERWKQKVGNREAERIRTDAATRGRTLHEMAETFMLHGTPGSGPWWTSIEEFLKDITGVHLIEGPVWHPLGFAGTVDALVDWRGVPTVIDWKTARSFRRASWVEDYKLQTVAYGGAANWLYRDHGFKVQRGIVVVALEDQPAQVFHIEHPELVLGWHQFTGRLNEYRRVMREFSDELFGPAKQEPTNVSL